MTGCTESARPIDLICTNENIETKFQTDSVSNSLIGSDGSKTDFYSDNFFEGVLTTTPTIQVLKQLITNSSL